MTTYRQTGVILPADDLRVGAYVAVHSCVVSRTSPVDSEEEHFGRVAPQSPARAIAFGVPLQVRAITLPYVICAAIHPGGSRRGPVLIDMRQVRLMRVSRKYVSAMTQFGNTRKSEAKSASGSTGSS